MAEIFSGILNSVKNALASYSDSAIAWEYNGVEIEGRGNDTFYTIGVKEFSIESEMYQSASCKYRKVEPTLRCSIFSESTTDPTAMVSLFENEICASLFASSLAISSVKNFGVKYNKEYDRMELCSEIALKTYYIYE